MIPDTSAQDRPLARASGWRRWAPWAALVMLAALAVAAAVAWAPGLLQSASTQTSVSQSRLVLATVERGNLIRDLSAEGRVVAAVSPTLYAPSAGAVTLLVKAGDSVSRGQVLAQITSPELDARLAQEQSGADTLHADHLRAQVDARQQRAALQSAHDNARIDHAAAENELARQQKAFEAGAVAGAQVERARDALQKARIALAQAQGGLNLRDDSLKFDVQARQLAHARQLLQVQELQRQRAALAVRSPVDGQVGQLFVAEKANVARDAQLLSVVDLSALEVQMQVAESFARELAPGMAGEISGGGQRWNAVVRTISPEVVNNEVSARLRFDGATPRELRQNQRLSVRVLLEQRNNVLTLARGSFVDENGGTQAWVLRDGVATRTPLRLGARGLEKVEVLSGLAVGDQVVVSGAQAFGAAERVMVSR